MSNETTLKSFGHTFQIKVLYTLLHDKGFLQSVYDILHSDYFEAAAHRWTVDYILQYYQKYNTHPTVDVLAIEVKKVKDAVLKVAIKEELKQVYDCETNDIKYVKDEFYNFCFNQKLKSAILKSVDLLESGEFEAIRGEVNNALKAGEKKEPGHILSRDIESRYREEDVVKVPLPFKELNEITDGGLEPGNVMIIAAGHGGGKSTLCCCCAVEAARQGFVTFYYTLELSEKYVGKKIDNILTGIEMKDLKHNRKLIEEANATLKGEIIVKEYYPGRSSLDAIEAHIRQMEDIEGITPDLVIIDYPELLRARKSRKDATEESVDTYTDIKGLAKEMGFRIICPSQLNREGMKADIAESGGTSGTISKQFIADFSLTLSRKREDKLNKTGRLHVVKSRLGPDGMTYNMHIDLRTGDIRILSEYVDPQDVDTNSEDLKERLKQKPVFRKVD